MPPKVDPRAVAQARASAAPQQQGGNNATATKVKAALDTLTQLLQSDFGQAAPLVFAWIKALLAAIQRQGGQGKQPQEAPTTPGAAPAPTAGTPQQALATPERQAA